jgi:hypothetical protein
MNEKSSPQDPKQEENNMQLTEQKYREISLKRHMTVRIPRGIAKAIEEFIKTEQAAKMGFDSKADVVTAAIRTMLTEYGYYDPPKNPDKET